MQLVRSDRPDPDTNDEAFSYLRVLVKDPDASSVGRAFSNKAVEMALANYPGFFITSPPGEGSPYGVYWRALVPSELVEHRVVIGGETIVVPPVIPPPGARGRRVTGRPVAGRHRRLAVRPNACRSERSAARDPETRAGTRTSASGRRMRRAMRGSPTP